jgi:hypothetical protein
MSDDEYDFEIEEHDIEGRDEDEEEKHNIYEEEPKFVQGVKQYEQMGEYDPLYQEFGGDFENGKKLYMHLSPEELFNKGAKEYIASKKELQTISKINLLKVIEKLQKIEYKNPKAFVLAYYYISILQSKNFLENMIKFVEDDLSLEDIVRYIRLIKSL